MDTDATSKNPKSAAMWEYEAPQYCDFSAPDTFVANDPNMDKFFCKS